MAEKPILLGSTTTTPVDNKRRKEVVLPGPKSKDFVLTARCRIINIGMRIGITASDLPGESGGIYSWTTSSQCMRLANEIGPTVAVEGLAVGTGRDSEAIVCTRRGSDGSTRTKTVLITVAKVTFCATAAQEFGFDDFDTPEDHTDDHVSIGSGAKTFVGVKIEGGAVGTDFTFVCDDTAVCTVANPAGSTAFDLPLHAGIWQKNATTLRAKVNCPSLEIFASISLHVYNETVVKVVIAKVADSRSPDTTLRDGTADYAAHQKVANDKLKEAVVRYELKNFDSANAVTDIAFDNDNNGVLSYDINAAGGEEFDVIKSKFSSFKRDRTLIVIVRNMRSLYYLAWPARKGDTSIHVRGSYVYATEMPLGTGSTQETVVVVSKFGHLETPLKFDHAVGEILEFPAAAWANDPIVIAEGNSKLDDTKWTILHEVGHTALGLMDIVDTANFMNANQGNTDNRLRYCPREGNYNSETENQWETIPRQPVKKKP